MLCSGPIGGAYALPSEISATLATQLKAQHSAQSLLYGGAPSAVAYFPPPPTRGRSAVRNPSRQRAPPVAPDAGPPVPVRFLGGPLFGLFFSF